VKKRVVFMGGKKIGKRCLDILRRHPGVELVKIIQNPNEIPWLRKPAMPRNINHFHEVMLIRQEKPDLIICVYYDQILKRPLLDIPPMGCINLHLALAEEYRGCYPTTWAIINGETETGVTLHYMDEGIDTGPIISQAKVPIYEWDTGKDLYERCVEAGVGLFRQTLPSILAGESIGKKQEIDGYVYQHERKFPSHEIPASNDLKDYIRALYFPPWPKPYVDIGGRKFYLVEEGDMPDD